MNLALLTNLIKLKCGIVLWLFILQELTFTDGLPYHSIVENLQVCTVYKYFTYDFKSLRWRIHKIIEIHKLLCRPKTITMMFNSFAGLHERIIVTVFKACSIPINGG